MEVPVKSIDALKSEWNARVVNVQNDTRALANADTAAANFILLSTRVQQECEKRFNAAVTAKGAALQAARVGLPPMTDAALHSRVLSIFSKPEKNSIDNDIFTPNVQACAQSILSTWADSADGDDWRDKAQIALLPHVVFFMQVDFSLRVMADNTAYLAAPAIDNTVAAEAGQELLFFGNAGTHARVIFPFVANADGTPHLGFTRMCVAAPAPAGFVALAAAAVAAPVAARNKAVSKKAVTPVPASPRSGTGWSVVSGTLNSAAYSTPGQSRASSPKSMLSGKPLTFPSNGDDDEEMDAIAAAPAPVPVAFAPDPASPVPAPASPVADTPPQSKRGKGGKAPPAPKKLPRVKKPDGEQEAAAAIATLDAAPAPAPTTSKETRASKKAAVAASANPKSEAAASAEPEAAAANVAADPAAASPEKASKSNKKTKLQEPAGEVWDPVPASAASEGKKLRARGKDGKATTAGNIKNTPTRKPSKVLEQIDEEGEEDEQEEGDDDEEEVPEEEEDEEEEAPKAGKKRKSASRSKAQPAAADGMKKPRAKAGGVKQAMAFEVPTLATFDDWFAGLPKGKGTGQLSAALRFLVTQACATKGYDAVKAAFPGDKLMWIGGPDATTAGPYEGKTKNARGWQLALGEGVPEGLRVRGFQADDANKHARTLVGIIHAA